MSKKSWMEGGRGGEEKKEEGRDRGRGGGESILGRKSRTPQCGWRTAEDKAVGAQWMSDLTGPD